MRSSNSEVLYSPHINTSYSSFSSVQVLRRAETYSEILVDSKASPFFSTSSRSLSSSLSLAPGLGKKQQPNHVDGSSGALFANHNLIAHTISTTPPNNDTRVPYESISSTTTEAQSQTREINQPHSPSCHSQDGKSVYGTDFFVSDIAPWDRSICNTNPSEVMATAAYYSSTSVFTNLTGCKPQRPPLFSDNQTTVNALNQSTPLLLPSAYPAEVQSSQSSNFTSLNAVNRVSLSITAASFRSTRGSMSLPLVSVPPLNMSQNSNISSSSASSTARNGQLPSDRAHISTCMVLTNDLSPALEAATTHACSLPSSCATTKTDPASEADLDVYVKDLQSGVLKPNDGKNTMNPIFSASSNKNLESLVSTEIAYTEGSSAGSTPSTAARTLIGTHPSASVSASFRNLNQTNATKAPTQARGLGGFVNSIRNNKSESSAPSGKSVKSDSPHAVIMMANASKKKTTKNDLIAVPPSNADNNINKNFGLDLDGTAEGTDESYLAGEDSMRDEHSGNSKDGKKFSAISAQLNVFSYVLMLAGLKNTTSTYYRNWLRVVTYSCTLLCATNLGLHTASYRNPLFDVTLVLLHVLVCVSYEWWVRYCRSKEWKQMMSIVTKVNSAHFAKHIRILGLFGLIMVCGATLVIMLGWELPIFADVKQALDYGVDKLEIGDFIFLLMHGVLMITIIAPWAAVCMCSVCLFKLVILAHQCDVEHHFIFLKQTLSQAMEQAALEQTLFKAELEKAAQLAALGHPAPISPVHGQDAHKKYALTASGGSTPVATNSGRITPATGSGRYKYEHIPKRDLVAENFRLIVKHHQAVRARLRVTCAYFNWLYFGFMACSTLMVFAAAMDFNHYGTQFPFPQDTWNNIPTGLFPQMVQDVFFVGLGALGLYAIFYVPSDLDSSFRRFVRRINDLVMAFQQSTYAQSSMGVHPASLAGLISYYQNSQTAYTLFGMPVTFTLFGYSLYILALVLFFNLWLININFSS